VDTKNDGRQAFSQNCRAQKMGTGLGFTLIEILVTLAIFTAVLGVLVDGLYSGIRAWRSVRSHQVRQAEFDVAAATVSEDLRHVRVGEGGAIGETSIEGGGEKLRVTTSVGRRRQRAGMGWVWNEVEYSTAKDEEGKTILLRKVQRYAGKSAVGTEPVEETLLTKIKSVQFDYIGPEGQVTVWESKDSLPLAVLFRIQPETGAEVAIPAWVPAGSLNRSGT
jgi:prepilin-type N-terminal cleavage/methylation domain-containing protein